jgi:hypothetical protein
MVGLVTSPRAQQPIGICVDKPLFGNYVGQGGTGIACDSGGATQITVSSAKGWAEKFARDNCPTNLTVTEGNSVCSARGGTLIRVDPALSNNNDYAIELNINRGTCFRVVVTSRGTSPVPSGSRSCGPQPPPNWPWPWYWNWAPFTARDAFANSFCGYVCTK